MITTSAVMIYTTITNFSTKYLVTCKLYTVVDGIKKVIPCLSICTEDNPLAKARGLSPRIGGQAMDKLLHILHDHDGL